MSCDQQLLAIFDLAYPLTGEHTTDEYAGNFEDEIYQTCRVLEELGLVIPEEDGEELHFRPTPRLNHIIADLAVRQSKATIAKDEDSCLVEEVLKAADGQGFFDQYICSVFEALGLATNIPDGGWQPTQVLKNVVLERLVHRAFVKE